MHDSNKIYRYQNGAATLLVSIILLVGITLIALYATRVGLLDQKISGNEYRHKIAVSHADAGLEQAAAYLRANPSLHESGTAGWTSCSGLTSVFPCDIDGAEFVYGTAAASTITSSVDTLPSLTNSQSFLVRRAENTVAVGVGTTADATGSAIAMIEYAQTSLLSPGEIPPLMAPTVDLSGNFTIVPNPNGGGPGVPVSAWVSSTDSGNGSWQTCQHGEYQDTGAVCIDTYDDTDSWKVCDCTESISDKDNIGSDIVVDAAGEFPYSPFAFVFQEYIDPSDPLRDDKVADLKIEIEDRAKATGFHVPNCGALAGPPTTVDGVLMTTHMSTPGNEPLIWVDGDCSFPAGSTVILGDRTNPLIMVVNGDISANGTLDVFGILVGLENFSLNGNTVIHGSAISDQDSDLTNGSYAQVYDESVFERLADDTLNTNISKVKYSWRDFTP
jgi:Tfp pilus assembly protein PilX